MAGRDHEAWASVVAVENAKCERAILEAQTKLGELDTQLRRLQRLQRLGELTSHPFLLVAALVVFWASWRAAVVLSSWWRYRVLRRPNWAYIASLEAELKPWEVWNYDIRQHETQH